MFTHQKPYLTDLPKPMQTSAIKTDTQSYSDYYCETAAEQNAFSWLLLYYTGARKFWSRARRKRRVWLNVSETSHGARIPHPLARHLSIQNMTHRNILLVHMLYVMYQNPSETRERVSQFLWTIVRWTRHSFITRREWENVTLYVSRYSACLIVIHSSKFAEYLCKLLRVRGRLINGVKYNSNMVFKKSIFAPNMLFDQCNTYHLKNNLFI